MRRLGVHTSIAGGLHLSLQRAHELGCTTMQIFSHNPRSWLLKSIPEDGKALFKNLRKELDINPVYIHTSYLINMASSSDNLWRKSIAMLIEEMNRADSIGADFVIFHTGSASGSDKGAARQRAIKGLKEVFSNQRWSAGLLLENTAGERGDITSAVTELAEIMDALKGSLSGICIDTCHAFAAGYDIGKGIGIKRLYDEIEKNIGIDKIKLIHLNDSRHSIGSHRDRHEHIGIGYIGIKGLRAFINYKMFSDIPLILETPKETEADDIRNVKKVRGMLKPASST